MMKYCTCFLLLVIGFLSGTAQSISNTLDLYSNNFPQEKVHLHTDKDAYFSGETVWFKAYILADDLPTNVSTNLYSDLISADGKLLEHKTMPVLNSSADSYFKLPDNAEGTYFIRIYSTWMLNFDTTFLYHRIINIINNTAKQGTTDQTPGVSLQFFAESGNLLANQYNYVAFKAMQSNGMPYPINAAIKNSKGELIDSISAMHDGMGLLKFTPEANETYLAEWKDITGEDKRTPLPVVQSEGVVLHTQKVKKDLYYLINTSTNTGNLQELTIVATMFQKIVYQAGIKMLHLTANQKIDTRNFPTGILQLTVFDKNNQPVAERIAFVNNNNYSFTANLNVTEANTGKRGKNKLEIEVPDTLSSNLSMAVYDAGLEQPEQHSNIYADFLLQDNIKGYVYNANWYFETNTAEAVADLDLVMQTNGWRRYNWNNIVAGKMPEITFPRDNYLSIYGKVTDEKQKPKPYETINIQVQTKDSTKQWYTPAANKDGLFTLHDLIFYDTATVLYYAYNKAKKVGVGIAKDYNGMASVKLNNQLPAYIKMSLQNNGMTDYTQKFKQYLKDAAFEQKAKLLNEIVVNAKNARGNRSARTDAKYATGVYRGNSGSLTFDLLHDENAANSFDIYTYLSGKIPGASVRSTNVGKYITVSGTAPRIFVDENLQDDQYLNTINIEDIAYVKYFDHSYGMVASDGQLTPTLAIYLKRDGDYKTEGGDFMSNYAKIKIPGYSPTKEFYSPDYSVPNDKQTNTDLRTTLLWQPYILTNKDNKKATISFYNNDVTKKLKVVIEGMNDEGKLIHIEKIIE